MTVTATPDGRSSSAVDSRTSAAVRSELVGLSGDGCGGGNSCSFVMDSDKAVSAQFALSGGNNRPNRNQGNRRGGHGGGGHGHDSGNFSIPGNGDGGDGGTGAASGAGGDEGTLAFTGFNLLVLVLIGIALLILGTTLLVRDRIAQRAGDHP